MSRWSLSASTSQGVRLSSVAEWMSRSRLILLLPKVWTCMHRRHLPLNPWRHWTDSANRLQWTLLSQHCPTLCLLLNSVWINLRRRLRVAGLMRSTRVLLKHCDYTVSNGARLSNMSNLGLERRSGHTLKNTFWKLKKSTQGRTHSKCSWSTLHRTSRTRSLWRDAITMSQGSLVRTHQTL